MRCKNDRSGFHTRQAAHDILGRTPHPIHLGCLSRISGLNDKANRATLNCQSTDHVARHKIISTRQSESGQSAQNFIACHSHHKTLLSFVFKGCATFGRFVSKRKGSDVDA
jgi:hypothetical protein